MTNMIQPLYLNTIFVGNLFNLSHFQRSIIGKRLASGIVVYLKKFNYRINVGCKPSFCFIPIGDYRHYLSVSSTVKKTRNTELVIFKYNFNHYNLSPLHLTSIKKTSLTK